MSIVLLALAFVRLENAPKDKDVAPPPAFATAARQCENAQSHRARTASEPVRPGKLGDQPVADQYLTVLRLEGGCDKPIKVRQAIGDGIEDQR